MLRPAVSTILIATLLGLTLFAAPPAQSARTFAADHVAPVGGHPTAPVPNPETGMAPRIERATSPAFLPTLTIIFPNGTVGGAPAPINQNGNTYTLTAGFTGAILDEANVSTLNGAFFDLNATSTVADTIEVWNAHGITVENFRITNASNGISMIGCTGGGLRGNTIQASNYAIDIEDSQGQAIWNNTAHLAGIGVYLLQSTGLSLIGNAVGQSQFYAFYVDFSSGATITNNSVNSSYSGIYAYESSGLVLQGNNGSGDSNVGIDLLDCTDAQLEGNTLSTDNVGIYVEHSSNVSSRDDAGIGDMIGFASFQAHNVSAWNDSFSVALYWGADVEFSSLVTIAYGQFSGAGSSDLQANGSVGLNVLQNNLSSYWLYGLSITSCQQVSVSANILRNPAQSASTAVYVYGSRDISVNGNIADHANIAVDAYMDVFVNISGNDFSHAINNHEAIYLELSQNLTVTQNNLLNASYDGISVSSVQGVTIAQNNITWAGYFGIVIQETSGAQVQGNDLTHAYFASFYGNGDAGIRVDGNILGWTGLAAGFGVFVQWIIGGSVTNNSISHTGSALEIDRSTGIQVWSNNASLSTNGLSLVADVNSVFAGNSLWGDQNGFHVDSNSRIWIYHNNFVDDLGWSNVASLQTIHWENGYPSGGNYWSNHTGPDLNGSASQSVTGADGIVDTPVVLNATSSDPWPLTGPWKNSYLKFVETGLAVGTPWSVTVGGSSWTGSSSSIWYTEPNAAKSPIQFNVPSVAGYLPPTPASGTVTPIRTNHTVAIVFTQQKFNLSFTEQGLPNGTTWNVTVDAKPYSSTNRTILVPATNGTHSYKLAAIVGKYWLFSNASSSGNVTVSGKGVVFPLEYTLVGPPPAGSTPGGTNVSTTGFSNGQFYGLLALALLFATLAIIGFALWLSARRPKPPSGATPWTPPPPTSIPPTPPSPWEAPPSGELPPAPQPPGVA